MSKPRIYVAGPLTKGDWAKNIRAALDVADTLRANGFVPVIPHLSAFDHLVWPREYEFWLEEDLSHLGTCHALLRMPGESSGADREVAWAQARGIPVVHDWTELWAALPPTSRADVVVSEVVRKLALDVARLEDRLAEIEAER